MKNDTILFKILGSDKMFTQDEVQSIIKRDPDVLLITYPVIALGDPRYSFIGHSDKLYTLSEIHNIIKRDPFALFTVYQSNSKTSSKDDGNHVKRMGDMSGQNALLKFG